MDADIGGGLGCREEEGIACEGAVDELATIDRRGPLKAGGTGLRLPPLEGPALVLEGGCSSEAVGGFTMFTSGGATGATMPAVLPLLCSMRACCCCFRLIMDRTCSSAFGSLSRMVKPMTTGEMPLSTEGRRTSVLMPAIVIRRFFDGFGEAEAAPSSSLGLCCAEFPGCSGGTESPSYSCLIFTGGLGDRRLQCASRRVSGRRHD